MRRLLFVLMIFVFGIASAQGTKTVAVKVSDKTQQLGNKDYYVHIVEQGQTVFSIARAYGLKYYDAVIKTDIHLLKVGDTVWLPKNENSVAAVSAAADAMVAPANRTHYIKIEPGQTLYGLSREYGVTMEEIVDANPELKTEQLKAGQMLKIPPRKTAEVTERETNTPTRVETKKEDNVAQQVAAEKQRQEQLAAEKQRQEQLAAEKQRQEQLAAEKQRQEQLAAEKQRQQAQSAEKQRPNEQAAKAIYKRQEQQQSEKVQTDNISISQFTVPTIVVQRPVADPYTFEETYGTFPSAQAPFMEQRIPTATFNYNVRELQNNNKVFVSLILPLNLDKINEISTSKFDIEQRGKKEYKVFEFIQFYEGILMALDQLQEQGCNVVLNVVDLTSDKDEDVVAAFNSHNVANSDFIIALLVKKPFEKLAQLAKENKIFVINPFSSRSEVVQDNPYVVKYMPSYQGTVASMLDIVAKKHKGGQLYIIHSNNKRAGSEEHLFYNEFSRQLSARTDIKYTFFDWAANAKLITSLKSTDDNVIISIYDQDKNKNTVFATTLLNRLSSLNSHVPTLMSTSNYLVDNPNVDFEQLQHLDYTTITIGYLDYANDQHKKFIDTYKQKFRTEPNTLYAGVAHDIMLYFVTALSQKGAAFWMDPSSFNAPQGLLFPLRLEQSSASGGYENQSPDIYQMRNYKLIRQ